MNQVTEMDLRAPEFRQGEPADYERRDDGKIVRKDRFARGMQDIAAILFGARHQYEIPEVVAEVHRLQGVRVMDLIEQAEDIYESEPKALECLDYLKQLIAHKKEPT